MPELFISNVPHDCQDAELRQWVESHGFPVHSVRTVRDLVTGISPAFGYIALRDGKQESEAIRVLNGKHLKDRLVQVKKDWRKAKVAT